MNNYKINYENLKNELEKYFSFNFDKIYYNEKPYLKDKQNEEKFELKFLSYSNLIVFINLDDPFSFQIFYQKFEQLLKKIHEDKDYSLLDRIKIMFTFSSLYLSLKSDITIELLKIKQFNSESSFIKGEKFFRNVIKELEEYSQLFFIYLQLNSGIGVNAYDNNTYYRISMIDLNSIKRHLLSLSPKYFFCFRSENCDDIALTCPSTLIESFNEKKLFNNPIDMYYGNTDSSMGYSLLQLHETGHGKFNGESNGENSPRFFLNSNYEPVEQKTWEEEKNRLKESLLKTKSEDNNVFCNKGESGKCIDFYLYNGVPLIIFSLIKSPNIKLLRNINYFTGPSLIPLYKRIDEISFQEKVNKELKVENNITINKIQSNQTKYKSKFEEMAENYFKLNSEERIKLSEFLYPKNNIDEENKEDIYYDLKAPEKIITRRSDYDLFMISN